MKLKDKELLTAYMRHTDFSQARLARAVGTSRQFIHMLASGEKSSCSEKVGSRIEQALNVPPGTLFLRQVSPNKGQRVASRTKVAA